MKILFLIKSAKTPSSRIRIQNLIPVLDDHGIDSEVEILPTAFFARKKLFRKAADFQVTVLQKRLLSALDFKILRYYANYLIFDFDDAVYHRNAKCSQKIEDYQSRTRISKFRKTVTQCDMVIAANNVLAGKTKEIAPGIPVEVVHSPVPVKNIPLKKCYSLQEPPVIGWVGGKSTLHYLDYIADELRDVQKEINFILRIIADKPLELDGIDVDFKPWTLESQEKEIANFDIGIMPLSPDPFSAGKSSYKLLQYMASAVPSLASAVGMNVEVSTDNEYCLLAHKPGEFATQLNRLLNDQDLRQALGVKGRQMVSREYSEETIGGKLAGILKKLKKSIDLSRESIYYVTKI